MVVRKEEDEEEEEQSLENGGKQAIPLNIEGRDFLVCELCVSCRAVLCAPRVWASAIITDDTTIRLVTDGCLGWQVIVNLSAPARPFSLR